MSENRFFIQHVVKGEYGVNEQGELAMVYSITEKKFAVPNSKMVADEDGMISAVNSQLDYLTYKNLASAAAKAEKKLSDLRSKHASLSDIAKAEKACADADMKFSLFCDEVMNKLPERDDIARIIACTFANYTGKDINLESAKSLLVYIRNEKNTDEQAKAKILEYIGNNINFASAPYFKAYETRLKLDSVKNLRKLATMYRLKATEKDIETKRLKDIELVYQLILEIMKECFYFKDINNEARTETFLSL